MEDLIGETARVVFLGILPLSLLIYVLYLQHTFKYISAKFLL